MFDWFHGHEAWAWWLAAGSAAMFVGTLVVLPIVLARIPADYFLEERRAAKQRHPALRWTLRIGRNALGVVLLIAGVGMLVLPGQGLLAMLAGLMLMEFPGKRRLERWLVRRKPIRRAVDWVRAKRGVAPLRLP